MTIQELLQLMSIVSERPDVWREYINFATLGKKIEEAVAKS